MLYHGRQKTIDGPETRALSHAEKYLGYPASQDWVMYDSGCTSTGRKMRRVGDTPKEPDGTLPPPFGIDLGTGVYQDCAAFTFPYCPLRLDSKQVTMHPFYNSAESVESVIERRMTQGYGPGGQGPISPIVIGISGCDIEDWREGTDWETWVRDNSAGSVYTVRLNSCGGGSISMMGSDDNSATGLPGGSPDGSDNNQTSCGQHVFVKNYVNPLPQTQGGGGNNAPNTVTCKNGC